MALFVAIVHNHSFKSKFPNESYLILTVNDLLSFGKNTFFRGFMNVQFKGAPTTQYVGPQNAVESTPSNEEESATECSGDSSNSESISQNSNSQTVSGDSDISYVGPANGMDPVERVSRASTPVLENQLSLDDMADNILNDIGELGPDQRYRCSVLTMELFKSLKSSLKASNEAESKSDEAGSADLKDAHAQIEVATNGPIKFECLTTPYRPPALSPFQQKMYVWRVEDFFEGFGFSLHHFSIDEVMQYGLYRIFETSQSGKKCLRNQNVEKEFIADYFRMILKKEWNCISFDSLLKKLLLISKGNGGDEKESQAIITLMEYLEILRDLAGNDIQPLLSPPNELTLDRKKQILNMGLKGMAAFCHFITDIYLDSLLKAKKFYVEDVRKVCEGNCKLLKIPQQKVQVVRSFCMNSLVFIDNYRVSVLGKIESEQKLLKDSKRLKTKIKKQFSMKSDGLHKLACADLPRNVFDLILKINDPKANDYIDSIREVIVLVEKAREMMEELFIEAKERRDKYRLALEATEDSDAGVKIIKKRMIGVLTEMEVHLDNSLHFLTPRDFICGILLKHLKLSLDVYVKADVAVEDISNEGEKKEENAQVKVTAKPKDVSDPGPSVSEPEATASDSSNEGPSISSLKPPPAMNLARVVSVPVSPLDPIWKFTKLLKTVLQDTMMSNATYSNDLLVAAMEMLISTKTTARERDLLTMYINYLTYNSLEQPLGAALMKFGVPAAKLSHKLVSNAERLCKYGVDILFEHNPLVADNQSGIVFRYPNACRPHMQKCTAVHQHCIQFAMGANKESDTKMAAERLQTLTHRLITTQTNMVLAMRKHNRLAPLCTANDEDSVKGSLLNMTEQLNNLVKAAEDFTVVPCDIPIKYEFSSEAENFLCLCQSEMDQQMKLFDEQFQKLTKAKSINPAQENVLKDARLHLNNLQLLTSLLPKFPHQRYLAVIFYIATQSTALAVENMLYFGFMKKKGTDKPYEVLGKNMHNLPHIAAECGVKLKSSETLTEVDVRNSLSYLHTHLAKTDNPSKVVQLQKELYTALKTAIDCGEGFIQTSKNKQARDLKFVQRDVVKQFGNNITLVKEILAWLIQFSNASTTASPKTESPKKEEKKA